MNREVVTTLTRLSPEKNYGSYWYVDPYAYTIGPFGSAEDMEAHILERYEEVAPANFNAEKTFGD